MASIPDEIETIVIENEGFRMKKSEAELLKELIEKYNDLRNYVKEMLEPLL